MNDSFSSRRLLTEMARCAVSSAMYSSFCRSMRCELPRMKLMNDRIVRATTSSVGMTYLSLLLRMPLDLP